MSMWSVLNIIQALTVVHTTLWTAQYVETYAVTRMCQVLCVYSESTCLFLTQIHRRSVWILPCWTVMARGDRRGSLWRSSVSQTEARRFQLGGLLTWRNMDKGMHGGGKSNKSMSDWTNRDGCAWVFEGSCSSVIFQLVWQWVWIQCQRAALQTNINRLWLYAHFVFCLTVVNQCTVKAWIFLTAEQNAAKKKGINLTFTPNALTSFALCPTHARTGKKMQPCFPLRELLNVC